MIRVACHIHSEWSYDGKWSIPALATEFAGRGYRALLLTEHDRGFTEARWQQLRRACMDASTENLLVLPGIEYSDASNCVHVLVWGAPSFLGEGLPTGKLLDAVRSVKATAVLAHPSRKHAWQWFDRAWASGLTGIEIWNRKTDGWAPSTEGLRLVRETGCAPFVGMDFHARNQMFPLSTMLHTDEPLTEASVLASLNEGRCHSEAFGRRLDALAGWQRVALRVSEAIRRPAAGTYRAGKRWLKPAT